MPALHKRLADRKRRADGALHSGMNIGEVARIGAEDGGREIVSQGGLDGLDRLIGPGFDRNGLAPALDAVLVGQANENRRPRAALEEFEFTKQRIIETLDIDADNPSHLGHNPFVFPLPSFITALRPSETVRWAVEVAHQCNYLVRSARAKFSGSLEFLEWRRRHCQEQPTRQADVGDGDELGRKPMTTQIPTDFSGLMSLCRPSRRRRGNHGGYHSERAAIHRSRGASLRTRRAPAHAVPLRRGHVDAGAAMFRARAHRNARRPRRTGAPPPNCWRRNGSTKISRSRTRTISISCGCRSGLPPRPISTARRARHSAISPRITRSRLPPAAGTASMRWWRISVRRRSIARSSTRCAAAPAFRSMTACARTSSASIWHCSAASYPISPDST